MGGPPVFPFLLPGMGQQAFPMMDLDPNGGLSLTVSFPLLIQLHIGNFEFWENLWKRGNIFK